jgi:hypothetical protein
MNAFPNVDANCHGQMPAKSAAPVQFGNRRCVNATQSDCTSRVDRFLPECMACGLTHLAAKLTSGVKQVNVTHTFLAGRTVASSGGSTTIADFPWARFCTTCWGIAFFCVPRVLLSQENQNVVV